MDVLTLSGQVRDTNKKAQWLRTEGYVPGIYYGGKEKNTPLMVKYRDFWKVYQQGGENTVIDLSLDNMPSLKVLIHDIQVDPVTGSFEHVDFIHVDMKKEVSTHVPLQFIGTAPGVSELGGILTVNKHQLEIRCLPDNIPHEISVDITSLVDFRTSLHVRDISVPAGITVLDPQDVTVVTVSPPKVEEEVKPAEAVPVAGAEAAAPKEGEKAAETQSAPSKPGPSAKS